MSDLDAVTGGIADRLRRLPEVQALYPPRPSPLAPVLAPVRALAALVGATSDEAAVQVIGDAVEADIGVASGHAALEAGRVCVAAIREALPPAGAGRVVRVRIASVG